MENGQGHQRTQGKVKEIREVFAKAFTAGSGALRWNLPYENRLEIVTPWGSQSSIHLTYEQGPRVIAVLNS